MHCDVIVVGGGIVGLSAAIALRARGYSVVVMDSDSFEKTSSSRVYAINQASECLFQSIGVWESIRQVRISPYRHMQVWDNESQAHIHFDARMVGIDKLGAIIEESVIKQSLLDKAQALGVVLLANYKVEKVETGSDEVYVVAKDQKLFGQLLIVADGAHSSTRDLLNVPLTSWPYHQQAIVTTVWTEKSHQQTAYQIFLKEGPLAFLPLADEHECSIVWSTSQIKADHLMSLTSNYFSNELKCAFAATLGDMSLKAERMTYPLHMRHVKRYAGCRWVLMGDAAHTIHPMAGLGLNIGLADLSAWLTGMQNNQILWSTQLSGAYQRQRKYALWQAIGLMEGLNLLFTSSFLPIVALRGFGLNVCDRVSLLKRFLIEHAAGMPPAILS